MSVEGAVDIAGVDGCRAGWIAVVKRPADAPRAQIFKRFEDLVATLSEDAIIAVDMPIGLPEITGAGGRGPEALVRKLLGERGSSVFSIPSRAAVYTATDPFTTLDAWYCDHRTASAAARLTSNPPRGVSIQAFAIFPKIREIDGLLIMRPDLRHRIVESHPEVAFWRLNGKVAVHLPKKIRGQVSTAGIAARRTLLAAFGLAPAFLDSKPLAGSREDDFLDACAMLVTAARYANNHARCYPDPPVFDQHGIPIAIWA